MRPVKFPDEEDHFVAELLELPHFVEQHRVAQVEIRRRGVEPRFHLQRFAPLQFLHELRANEHLVRAPVQLGNLFLKSRRPFFVNPSSVRSLEEATVSVENATRGAPVRVGFVRRPPSRGSGSWRALCALTSGTSGAKALRLVRFRSLHFLARSRWEPAPRPGRCPHKCSRCHQPSNQPG